MVLIQIHYLLNIQKQVQIIQQQYFQDGETLTSRRRWFPTAVVVDTTATGSALL